MARLLEECTFRSQVVTIEGVAGVGKSTVLQAAREAAVAEGAVVLACAPTEVEQGYDYSALGDLLAPFGDLTGVAPALPASQRHALDTALLRNDEIGRAHV